MTNPKVSVIVPVYNVEKYLHRCIDSILAQTFTDFELLLVNDGSKDNSGKICDEYAAKDSRIRVFHKENSGVSSARNLGLDNVKGEWVTFCDSDDYVERCWLDNFIANSAGVDCVLQGFSNDIPLKYVSDFFYEGAIDGLLTELFHRQLVGYSVVKIFRVDIINKFNIRLNEDIRFREDEDFCLRYFCRISKVRHINKRGYVYIMPDLERKYSNYDNFYLADSMYRSVKYIYNEVDNIATKSYLYEYVMALFNSIEAGADDIYKRIGMFKENVGRNILSIDRVNIISRLILFLFPTSIIVPLFRFKSFIKNIKR